MTEVERAEQVARGPRRRFLQNVVLMVALLISLGAFVVAWQGTEQRASAAETSAVSLAQQVQQVCESQGSLDLDGRDLCAQADEVVEDPTTVTLPVPAKDGARGPGPTVEQIASAVKDYCASGRCDGSGPSRDQIASAVTAYCADDTCKGEPGKDALPAVDGKDGDQAPGPTADQIASAVDAYCASGACDGEDGKDAIDGTNGTNGTDGRSIVKTVCHTTGDWIITYSDGTAETTAGPCRVVESSPAPTTTPPAITRK